MNILLLGCGGQVGWELQRALAPLGTLHAFDFSGRCAGVGYSAVGMGRTASGATRMGWPAARAHSMTKRA